LRKVEEAIRVAFEPIEQDIADAAFSVGDVLAFDRAIAAAESALQKLKSAKASGNINKFEAAARELGEAAYKAACFANTMRYRRLKGGV